MKRKSYRVFMGDFETTVYEGQTTTEVWASALVELYTEDVKLFHSIDETFEYLFSLDENCKIYYHNLKFDGSYILYHLITKLKFEQAYIKTTTESGTNYKWIADKDMRNDTFKYSISAKGMWYSITVKHKAKYYTFQDSLKLLPFSVKQVGKGFNTKHQKLDMEYKGYRYAGCEITEEEQSYIKNDVLVIKEALEAMYDRGHTALTIGSCCLTEYKNIVGRIDYKAFFPNLYEINIPTEDLQGNAIDTDDIPFKNIGEYIRKAYRGGWCYLLQAKANKIVHNGCTADVNSLYPSVMHSVSGSKYPVGRPHFNKGSATAAHIDTDKYFYFIRIRTRFYLKKGFLPFIQIKGNPLYDQRENLTTSDYWDKKQKKYFKFIKDLNGNTIPTSVEMVLTWMDYELIKKHYDLVELEELDYCWFHTEPGIYDQYISKYREIKQNTKNPVERQLAKLFLNNLYGKMAMSTDSSFKVAYIKENGALGYLPVVEEEKTPGYIACGAAITSYARCFTIRAAQANYHGANKPGFIYADTDSIHCDLSPSEVKGIRVDNSEFCCWKIEATWDTAIFVRQKTYIEHIVEENLVPIDAPYYNVKCAGMPENCKDLFIRALDPAPLSDYESEEYTDEEKMFLKKHLELTDFKVGLTIPGQLKSRNIVGGVLLVEQDYTMLPR